MSENEKQFLEKLVSVVPNHRQMNVLKMGYYNFIHFGTNTYLKREWGDGTATPDQFQLKSLDTDKWVQQLMATGSKGVIATAKHHDGFCLYPSKYTDYTVASSPFMNGKGDVLGQLAASCKKYGFKFGIYLSPWDRHEPSYGTDAYNDFFCNQLTELATNYGEIFCFWFDGACGEGANGKKQVYDWKRYFDLIYKLQPNAATSICGCDIRWIGNESGNARETEWSVVSTRMLSYDYTSAISQQEAGDKVMAKKISCEEKEIGSRSSLVGENLCYYPSEMDISASKIGWFWRKSYERFYARSPKSLAKCYNTSTGNNATLLVNIAPNTDGELPEKFINNLIKARKIVDDCFATKVETALAQTDELVYECSFANQKVSKIIFAEDVTKGQRIESFEVVINGKTVAKGTTVGFKKFCFFKATTCDKITLKITSCRLEPHLKYFKVFK